MFDWLSNSGADAPAISATTLFVRLVLAFVFGHAASAIYRYTKRRDEASSSMATTLVMLSILIAMVTQVVGGNVARAFSLVGALSIVRFRTVVQDTRDTAFVIFAVVVGMAVGAGDFIVAIAGTIVVAGAALLFRSTEKMSRPVSRKLLLSVRMAANTDPRATLSAAIEAFTTRHELTAVETARRGSALDVIYLVQLKPEVDATQLVAELNRLAGVQSVSLKRDV